MEAAKRRGMHTGAVVTSRITHATPASFTAHAKDRALEEFIAFQQIDHGFDVLMGGGFDKYNFTSLNGILFFVLFLFILLYYYLLFNVILYLYLFILFLLLHYLMLFYFIYYFFYFIITFILFFYFYFIFLFLFFNKNKTNYKNKIKKKFFKEKMLSKRPMTKGTMWYLIQTEC